MDKIKGFSTDQNVQMLIALMKEHGVRRVIVSPGTTHLDIVAGLQYDGSFEMFSTVDERGAAYMAVGMAAESGEPAAIICTESVASRNYYSAMTEAYYRQLPVLAITALRAYAKIGHCHPQVIDRSESPRDTFRLKVHLPALKDADDLWESNVLINKALLELRRHGGGPVHIDLPSRAEKDFSARELCQTRVIRRYCRGDTLPSLPKGKVAVFLGTHAALDAGQTEALDRFCASHDGVVFCGHNSGYYGKYRVLAELAAFQRTEYDIFNNIDLLIHVGGPASVEGMTKRLGKAAAVWRVDPDGELRDLFAKLTAVFEMDIASFFSHYSDPDAQPREDYLRQCAAVTERLVPPAKLPFSNVYAASVLSKRLPAGSLIHFGNSNSVRAWSMFELPGGVTSGANTGVRGIDGVLSSFLGASMMDRNRLAFCVIGDLAFFYDMNSLGNRDLGRNVRILLVNDGRGGLMKVNYVRDYMGEEETDAFLAAYGHFGAQSPTLVKGYAESLGFEYLTASSKEEFDAVYARFVTPELTDKPMLFELFTHDYEERGAFNMMYGLDVSLHDATKQMAKQLLGQKGTQFVKKIIK